MIILYILMCLISCWMCFHGDCVFTFDFVMRQMNQCTLSSLRESECWTEDTVVMRTEWCLDVLEKVYEWPLFEIVQKHLWLYYFIHFVRRNYQIVLHDCQDFFQQFSLYLLTTFVTQLNRVSAVMNKAKCLRRFKTIKNNN